MGVKGKRADARPGRAVSLKGGKDKKKPRQGRLPGMEGRLKDLDKAAEEYADGRDERMRLTLKEVELKANLIALMKKHDRVVYICGPIEIKLVPVGENVKVRIRHDDEEEGEEEQEPETPAKEE